jgi:hypothetical protein
LATAERCWLLDLVDCCISNSNSACKGVVRRIRPAATAAAAPKASPTVTLQDAQAAIALVCMSLQEPHGCLLNIREDAAALLQVTSAEQAPPPSLQKRPSPGGADAGAVSPAKKMCFFTPVKNLV